MSTGNSFYYFYSATPQVLAAVLALFGVFVIFKIQTIKTELLSISDVILEYIRANTNVYPRDEGQIALTNSRRILIREMRRYLDSKDVNSLKQLTDDIVRDPLTNEASYKKYKVQFDKEFALLNKLIDDTIKASKFTAVLIVVCLIVILLGNAIICRPVINYALATMVVFSLGWVFYKLITILVKAIAE